MSNPVEIIRRKRDGKKLSKEDLQIFFAGVQRGEIKDYQTSAMLMAIWLRGMDVEETSILTSIMRDSGKTLRWDFPRRLVVDKHSTGGVGDKTSLIILPLCAHFGLR